MSRPLLLGELRRSSSAADTQGKATGTGARSAAALQPQLQVFAGARCYSVRSVSLSNSVSQHSVEGDADVKDKRGKRNPANDEKGV